MQDGFANIGNSCYLNSLVQALLSIDCFKAYCKGSAIPILNRIANAKHNLLEVLQLMPWYRRGSQECVHEALTVLLDMCKIKMFSTQHIIVHKCNNCSYKLIKEDISNITLFNGDITPDSFNILTTDGEDCPNCQHKLYVHYILNKMSDIIAIAFNKYMSKPLYLFPDTITINTKDKCHAIYKLKAQIEHYGDMGGGHYVAQIYRNGKWYLANDSNVQEIPNNIPTIFTYMVFYELDNIVKIE